MLYICILSTRVTIKLGLFKLGSELVNSEDFLKFIITQNCVCARMHM